MAVSPTVVEISDDERELNRIETEIDALLCDPIYVKRNRFGTKEDPYWQVMVRGHLNKKEKELLTLRYVSVGWARVVVCNSEDNDPIVISGLVEIILYKTNELRQN